MTETLIQEVASMADNDEQTLDKVLSLLPQDSVELLNQCSEVLQQVVLSTTSNIYKDCEEHGIILDPIQQEVFINAFVRATTANSAFFMTSIDRSNEIIQAMTGAYQKLHDQATALIEKPQAPEPKRRGLFKR